MLNQKTISTLNELENAQWFLNVGHIDSDYPAYLNSWTEAIKSCESEQWEALCQEASNQYRARLQERNPDRFREWNATVKKVKEVSIPLVLKKTHQIVECNKLPKGFIDTVQWDILHLCMESEFADVFPPGFYASQAYWYVKGHFPCGWDGEFPNGKLIVY